MAGQSKLRRLRGVVLAVRKVEKQTRIRIGNELREILPWVEKGPVECWMELGPDGGVRLLPVEGTLVALDEDLAQLPTEAMQDLDDETLQYVATRATAWEVPLMYEPGADRYSLHLPEEARLLKVLPEKGEVAVALAIQGELQIWPGRDWVLYVRDGMARLEVLREAAARGLPLLEDLAGTGEGD